MHACMLVCIIILSLKTSVFLLETKSKLNRTENLFFFYVCSMHRILDVLDPLEKHFEYYLVETVKSLVMIAWRSIYHVFM